MQTPEIYNRDQIFAGTKGLVFFGETDVLSYIRDHNTDSFAGYVDLPGGGRESDETPFETFQRELDEEFGLPVMEEQIIFSRAFPSMLDANVIGYFVVASLPEQVSEQIKFGDEGESYSIMSLPELLASERLIPILRQRVNCYLEASASAEPEEAKLGAVAPTLSFNPAMP